MLLPALKDLPEFIYCPQFLAGPQLTQCLIRGQIYGQFLYQILRAIIIICTFNCHRIVEIAYIIFTEYIGNHYKSF